MSEPDLDSVVIAVVTALMTHGPMKAKELVTALEASGIVIEKTELNRRLYRALVVVPGLSVSRGTWRFEKLGPPTRPKKRRARPPQPKLPPNAKRTRREPDPRAQFEIARDAPTPRRRTPTPAPVPPPPISPAPRPSGPIHPHSLDFETRRRRYLQRVAWLNKCIDNGNEPSDAEITDLYQYGGWLAEREVAQIFYRRALLRESKREPPEDHVEWPDEA